MKSNVLTNICLFATSYEVLSTHSIFLTQFHLATPRPCYFVERAISAGGEGALTCKSNTKPNYHAACLYTAIDYSLLPDRALAS